MARLFSPPTDLIFRGNLEQARTRATENDLWVIVSIHDPSEFQCQMLNRDLWKDNAVKEIIQSSFVFLQFGASTSDGTMYANFYPRDSLPHIAIIDPRTGERVKVWSKFIAPMDMIMDRMCFAALSANNS